MPRYPAIYYEHPLFLRTVTVLFLLCGIGMLVVGGLMAAEFTERRDELYALRDAPTCAASPQGSAECQWPQEFIVSDIRIDDLGRRPRIFSAMLTTPNQKSEWP